ncbi:hypothetical protein V8E53_011123 [Lactarius tabidus]
MSGITACKNVVDERKDRVAIEGEALNDIIELWGHLIHWNNEVEHSTRSSPLPTYIVVDSSLRRLLVVGARCSAYVPVQQRSVISLFLLSSYLFECFAISISACCQRAKIYLEKVFEPCQLGVGMPDPPWVAPLRETLQQDKELSSDNTVIGIIGPGGALSDRSLKELCRLLLLPPRRQHPLLWREAPVHLPELLGLARFKSY